MSISSFTTAITRFTTKIHQPVMYKVRPRILGDFRFLPCFFPMVLLMSHVFPLVFLWLSYGFPMVSASELLRRGPLGDLGAVPGATHHQNEGLALGRPDDEKTQTDTDVLGVSGIWCVCVYIYIYIWYMIYPIGSMVLLYMVTWIPSIYPQC